MGLRSLVLGAAVAAALLSATSAEALTFNLISSGAGTAAGTQARKDFEIAAAYWSSVFTDNVTVNLTIGYSSLGSGILAQTGHASSVVSMQTYYSAIQADAKTALDSRAVAALPTLSASGGVTATTNGFKNGINGSGGYTNMSTRVDNDNSTNNTMLSIPRAEAKALGLSSATSSDASITFSSNFNFDFDPTDGIASDAYDFIGVAIHEIGHALGFVSGVDSYDSHTAPTGGTAATPSSLENTAVASALDLYRYSSSGTLDWSTQSAPYFSVDKGQSELFGDSLFSTGTTNGDGHQASHWKDSPAGSPQLGVMDPTSGLGQMQEVTALDLSVFDSIGWDLDMDILNNSSYRFSTSQAYSLFGAVPEPASWAMMIIGFGGIGGAMRRQRGNIRFA